MQKIISKLFILACLGASSFALAQDGCFYKPENSYLNLGAMRADVSGEKVCSKLPNGEYVWVSANDFDRSGGCWYVDKYPVSAIKEMVNELKQCVFKDGGYEWVSYKSHS